MNDADRNARFSELGPRRFVVSGATGLVGEALVRFLTGGGHEVVRLVRTSPTRPGDVRWDPTPVGSIRA